MQKFIRNKIKKLTLISILTSLACGSEISIVDQTAAVSSSSSDSSVSGQLGGYGGQGGFSFSSSSGLGGDGNGGSGGEKECYPEICNNLDDDCDGTIIESTFEEGLSCFASEKPLNNCWIGKLHCAFQSESIHLVCSQFNKASQEICGNSIDDDCNNQVDENCPCSPPKEIPCFLFDPNLIGKGVCKVGYTLCSLDGKIEGTCLDMVGPEEEDTEIKCQDQVDNDCNGLIDQEDPRCQMWEIYKKVYKF